MAARKLVGILFSVLVLGGLFWYRMKVSSDVQERIELAHVDIDAALERCKDCQKHDTFLAPLVTLAHRTAEEAAYTPGSRRRAPTFDEDVFIKKFFESLESRAKMAQKPDLDLALRELQIEVEKHQANSEPW